MDRLNSSFNRWCAVACAWVVWPGRGLAGQERVPGVVGSGGGGPFGGGRRLESGAALFGARPRGGVPGGRRTRGTFLAGGRSFSLTGMASPGLALLWGERFLRCWYGMLVAAAALLAWNRWSSTSREERRGFCPRRVVWYVWLGGVLSPSWGGLAGDEFGQI